MQSTLATANQAFQKGETAAAMAGYVNALLKMPELGKTIAGNIFRIRQQYNNNRNDTKPPKVVVCGWELAHNAAGRAHTLAEIYREITSDVEIVGSIFPLWGRKVWEPMRDTTIPVDTFVVEAGRFIEQALALVAAHPADVVHLSKPRAPNVYFGVFYKLLWGARVIVDIDDEELSFVKAETPLTVFEYLQEYPTLPPLDQLTDAHWTRIAVGLVNEFDGITVSNIALQRRYGGIVVGHARDPKFLKPSPELRQRSREALGIQQEQKVVLFSGTPRPHKGLLEVAKAIQGLNRDDIIFVIAGSFGERHLQFKANLQAVKGVKFLFLENLPLSQISSTLAIADCCVLLQDISSPTTTFQIPAKLSDALAMQVPVIATETPALSDAIAAGAVIPANFENLAQQIAATLDNPGTANIAIAYSFFMDHLTCEVNAAHIQNLIKTTRKPPLSHSLLQINALEECKYVHPLFSLSNSAFMRSS